MKADTKRKVVWTAMDIVLMALLAAILMLQKELMSALPNISLTVFLILLYAKCLGLGRTAVQIDRVAYHEANNVLGRGVFLEIIYYICRRYRLEGRGKHRQGVADRNSHACPAIVYPDGSVHFNLQI